MFIVIGVTCVLLLVSMMVICDGNND